LCELDFIILNPFLEDIEANKVPIKLFKNIMKLLLFKQDLIQKSQIETSTLKEENQQLPLKITIIQQNTDIINIVHQNYNTNLTRENIKIKEENIKVKEKIQQIKNKIQDLKKKTQKSKMKTKN
jgi:hypothetical protein